MTFQLRHYQQDAVDIAIDYVKKHTSPALLELATGAGKSLIVAELARFFAKAAPHKRVLCIAPSKELVTQNAAKYLAYGYPASVYCASAGSKCLRSQVIFASPQTAVKQAEKIARLGISAIIIDEAHGITESLKSIVDTIREFSERGKQINSNVRVIGMTATPYRLGTGYIYAIDDTGEEPIHYDETKAIEPYFNKLIYRITAGELVGEGFLSKVLIGEHSESYDTSTLETDKFGQFSAKSVAATFEGSTKTERIIAKVQHHAQQRKGVMIFAATISHAEEIMRYLLGNDARIVTGSTKKSEREEIIEQFKQRKFKYLVNVAVLTTGFDAPHVDFVAILRATESAGLLQQIVGRGLRLCDDKDNCLVMDFAENIERHGLQSDLFTPEIKTRIKSESSAEIEVQCPSCSCVTTKKRRSDDIYAGLKNDRFGNFLISGTEQAIAFDDEGLPSEYTGEVLTMQILDPQNKDEFGECGVKEIPVPAHYSRRCSNPAAYTIKGVDVPCDHRFSLKICPHCYAENDIAARHCIGCKERLVDPNKKLTEQAGSAVIMDDGETREVKCLGAEYAIHTTSLGNKTLKVTYKTELGAVTGWHSQKQHWIFNRLARANGVEPEFIRSVNDCAEWKAIPANVKIKKVIRDGFTNFEVKEVRFV